MLAAEQQVDACRLARIGVFAELGLGGDLRPCESADAAAQAAERAGLAGLIVARGDLRTARRATGLPVAGLGSLREVAALLAGALPRSPDARGTRSAERTRRPPGAARGSGRRAPDACRAERRIAAPTAGAHRPRTMISVPRPAGPANPGRRRGRSPGPAARRR